MYITYGIENLITGEIYYGSHKTDNIDDGYMGSGVLIKRSIDNYGADNHRKINIAIFDNRKDSVELEHSLIKERKGLGLPSLNASDGGASFDYINENLSLDRSSFAKLASHEWQKALSESYEKTYMKSAKVCKNCGAPLPYEKRRNVFCNQSCAATYNNKLKREKDDTNTKYRDRKKNGGAKVDVLHKKICKNCGNEYWAAPKNSKFCCSKCAAIFNRNKIKGSHGKLVRQAMNDKDRIVELHKEKSYRKIAAEYGVSANTIKEIVKGRL